MPSDICGQLVHKAPGLTPTLIGFQNSSPCHVVIKQLELSAFSPLPPSGLCFNLFQVLSFVSSAINSCNEFFIQSGFNPGDDNSFRSFLNPDISRQSMEKPNIQYVLVEIDPLLPIVVQL